MKLSFLLIAVFAPAILLSACSYHADEKAGSQMKKTDKHITAAPKMEKTSIDWTKPSGGEYPDIKQLKNVWIDVDVKQQKAYINAGSKTIYTMIVSSGLDQTHR